MEFSKNRLRGAVDKVTGKIKDAFGEATDNRDMKAEGKTQEFEGPTEQKFEGAKDKLRGKVRDMKDEASTRFKKTG